MLALHGAARPMASPGGVFRADLRHPEERMGVGSRCVMLNVADREARAWSAGRHMWMKPLEGEHHQQGEALALVRRRAALAGGQAKACGVAHRRAGELSTHWEIRSRVPSFLPSEACRRAIGAGFISRALHAAATGPGRTIGGASSKCIGSPIARSAPWMQ